MVAAFVIDTSETMAAKTSDGRSLMDHAKDVVEQMTVKNRHTPAHHVLLNNCLLLTTEDWPGNAKTSWADWGDKPDKRMARWGGCRGSRDGRHFSGALSGAGAKTTPFQWC